MLVHDSKLTNMRSHRHLVALTLTPRIDERSLLGCSSSCSTLSVAVEPDGPTGGDAPEPIPRRSDDDDKYLCRNRGG